MTNLIYFEGVQNFDSSTVRPENIVRKKNRAVLYLLNLETITGFRNLTKKGDKVCEPTSC